jgi:hypothetical protein
MDYVLDNLWYSNYKNLYVPMLYGLFHLFSSMLSIVHVQSTYNVNKSVTTIYMIFVYFSIYFLGTASPKTDGISFVENRFGKSTKPVGLLEFGSVYRYDLNFSTI